ncbi:helix-turn-helix domain-containing protein [Ureibacillus composti]
MVKFELKDNQNIKLMIALKGKSLRSFSKEIKVSHSYLSQIINGKRTPSAGVARKISDGLSKEMEDIFLIKLVDEQPKRVVSI